MHKHFQNEMAEKVRDILLCKPAEAKAFAVQVQDALDMHLTSDQHEVVVTQFGKVKRARTNATKAKQVRTRLHTSAHVAVQTAIVSTCCDVGML